MPIESIVRYDAWRGVQMIGDWFVLTKRHGVRSGRIRLGWELRLIGATRDGFELTQVCRSEDEVFDVRNQWKAKMALKGWQ